MRRGPRVQGRHASPVSGVHCRVRRQIAELGGVKNPYLDVRSALGFNRAYLAWRADQAVGSLSGEPYDIRRFGERGEAAPEL